MVARPVRHGDQHRGAVLPAPGVRIRLLPTHLDGGTRHHELVRGDVRGHSDHCSGILCAAGTALLHPARGARQARDVISTHLYSYYARGRKGYLVCK
jgi:hypothetical protein